MADNDEDKDPTPDDDLVLSDDDLKAVAGGGTLSGGSASPGNTSAGFTGTDQPVLCCGQPGCFPHPTTNIYCKIGSTITLSCRW